MGSGMVCADEMPCAGKWIRRGWIRRRRMRGGPTAVAVVSRAKSHPRRIVVACGPGAQSGVPVPWFGHQTRRRGRVQWSSLAPRAYLCSNHQFAIPCPVGCM